MLEWKGVFPALTTPLTANDELDMAMFEKSLSAQLNAGVHGVVIGGSLGEASTLTIAEKETLIKFCVEKNKWQSSGCLKYCRKQYERCVAAGNTGERMECAGIDVIAPDALQIR